MYIYHFKNPHLLLFSTLKASLTLNVIIAGFLITGGSPIATAGYSVEVYNPHSGSHCKLPDLPGDVRFYHSHCGHLLCGGYSSSTSCLLLNPTTGQFTTTSVTLRQERYGHLCWEGDEGDVLLMGGEDSGTTTELVSADGSTSSDSFTLEYDTR